MPDVGDSSKPPLCRCAECGFLALREYHGPRLLEAPGYYRETGEAAVEPGKHFKYESPTPICYARETSFRDEITPGQNEKVILASLEKERKCNSFTPWQPEFSPKEHQEMVNEKAMLEWQREREESDRAWRAKEHRTTVISLVVMAVIGILGVLASLWSK